MRECKRRAHKYRLAYSQYWRLNQHLRTVYSLNLKTVSCSVSSLYSVRTLLSLVLRVLCHSWGSTHRKLRQDNPSSQHHFLVYGAHSSRHRTPQAQAHLQSICSERAQPVVRHRSHHPSVSLFSTFRYLLHLSLRGNEQINDPSRDHRDHRPAYVVFITPLYFKITLLKTLSSPSPPNAESSSTQALLIELIWRM